MSEDWKAAAEEWEAFLGAVGDARHDLGCSVHNAWFRGLESESFTLAPSLFRIKPVLTPHGLIDDHLRRQEQVPEDLPLASDAELETENRLRAERLLRAISKMHAQMRTARDENPKLQSTWKDSRGNTALSAYVKGEAARLRAHVSDLRSQLERARLHLRVIRCLHYGERDAFVNFRVRVAGAMVPADVHGTSWDTLARMQHFGAPTRLLDWSTSLITALYFALKEYRVRLMDEWSKPANRADRRHAYIDPAVTLRPCVWILNPFRLTRQTASMNAIIDPSLNGRLDYYRSFLEDHDWPFRGCLPILCAWRHPRLAAQQGTFTVQGFDTRPLDVQMSSADAILRRVSLSPAAAIYGVRHLREVVGLGHFEMFRDEDHLSLDVRRIVQRG